MNVNLPPTGQIPNPAESEEDKKAGDLRRKMQSGLASLQEIFSHAALDDPLTKDLKLWFTDFQECWQLKARHAAASYGDMKSLMHIFIHDDLCRLLKDPLDGRLMLGRETLRGSDGNTYNLKTYCLYLSRIAPEAVELVLRSPLNIDNHKIFTVDREPHPVVTAVVDWLGNWPEECPTPHPYAEENVNLAYSQLIAEKRNPLLPTKENLFLIKRRISQLQKKQKEKKIGEEFSREAALMAAEVNALATEQFGKLQAEKEKSDKAELHRAQAFAERLATWKNHVVEEIAAAEARITRYEQENEVLRQRIARADTSTSELEVDNARLQIKINERQKEQEKRDTSWCKSLLRTAAIAAVCIVISAALPPGYAAIPLKTGALVAVIR